MLSLSEALDRLETALLALPRSLERVDLGNAPGRVLSESIFADQDDPPFDRSAMDGYAIRHEDASVGSILSISGRVRAGDPPPLKGPEAGCAFRIMTGAPLPPGTDTVLILEDGEETKDERVRIVTSPPSGANVRWRGEVRETGDVVCASGVRITPEVMAVLAGVGCTSVPVHRRPTVTILSTGDELVPVTEEPGPGQIRESNGWALEALAASAGAVIQRRGKVPDEPDALEEAVSRGIQSDVLVLSGGVSRGAFDHVRETLEGLGAEILFHGVAIRPGKPVLVAQVNSCLIFGLPGNPVSALITARVFLAPSLCFLGGGPFERPEGILGRLTAALGSNGSRLTFLPARVRLHGGEWEVTPVTTRGSADAVNHALGAGLILREPGAPEVSVGSRVLTWLQ